MKTKYSAIIDEARGKLGSVVASTGKGGSYMRGRVIPFNPKSVDQTAIRAKLATYSQAWASLTENQRTLWNDAVGDWKNSDVFGNKLTPSGFNLFCALNINLAILGIAQINTPPAQSSVPALITLSATQVHNGATTLVFTPTPSDANTQYVVEATKPMSAGRSKAFSEYRIVKVCPAGQTSPLAITVDYANKFGGPGQAGQKVFFRVYGIDTTSGKKGAPMSCVAIVS